MVQLVPSRRPVLHIYAPQKLFTHQDGHDTRAKALVRLVLFNLDPDIGQPETSLSATYTVTPFEKYESPSVIVTPAAVINPL